MARAIDADELEMFPYSEGAGTEEQISEWIEQAGLSEEDTADRARLLCWKVIEGYINVVKTQPTLTPPNEWVSVEERLPTDEHPVLVFVGYADTMTGFITTSSYFCFDENPHWQWDGLVRDEQRTLFWMPLPAPPDKGNNVPIKAPNEPLTQADLDSMDYDKVWIDYEDDCGEWALVCNGYIYSIDTLEGAGLDFGDYMRGERLEPHGYKVYRRPPEGEEGT